MGYPDRLTKIAPTLFVGFLFCSSSYAQDMGAFRQPLDEMCNDPIITTVAGGGDSSEDGVPATSAQLRYPHGVAIDAQGNVYIADTDNHKVRKIDGAGIITTVAGNGTGGLSGTGGPATSAQLRYPRGIDIDAQGNIYIADTYNHRIRMVSVGDPGRNFNRNYIYTVAGMGMESTVGIGFEGDGGRATGAKMNLPGGVAVDAIGNIYIADTSNNRIRMVSAADIPSMGGGYEYKKDHIYTIAGSGETAATTAASTPRDNLEQNVGDGSAATSSKLHLPGGVAIEEGEESDVRNIYIADSLNNRIRWIDKNGIINTALGMGWGIYGDVDRRFSSARQGEEYQSGFPYGVVVGAQGNIYVSETEDGRIRKIDLRGGVTLVAGNGERGFSGDGGPATSAQLRYPHGIAIDAQGNVYIADTGNNRIRKVSCPPATHLACRNRQCVSVEGKGKDLCRSSEECPYCEDSDGDNPPVRGYVTHKTARINNPATLFDQCVDSGGKAVKTGSILRENICLPPLNVEHRTKDYSCKCSGGACLK